jgi:hypothetical protein
MPVPRRRNALRAFIRAPVSRPVSVTAARDLGRAARGARRRTARSGLAGGVLRRRGGRLQLDTLRAGGGEADTTCHEIMALDA